ncbi:MULTISPECIES: hypothetical protein [unclassified Streptomyces]|uniref:hypothetical protein n=1 Tax=unclassified Streptomyces TaxID=2593676 RepID=UPI003679442C
MQRKLPAWFGGGPCGKGPGNGHLAARPTQWAAAHAFHKPGTHEAEAFAADRLTAILAGHAARVADELLALADQAHLTASPREAVIKARNVLRNQLQSGCRRDKHGAVHIVPRAAGQVGSSHARLLGRADDS